MVFLGDSAAIEIGQILSNVVSNENEQPTWAKDKAKKRYDR